MIREEVIKLFSKLKIKYGSCKITYIDGKKKPTFANGWHSEYNSKLNGVFICTGESSGIAVLDLDDMTNEVCKKLKILADECSNLKVKTRKGYHYYFALNETMKETIHKKEHCFDYLANNAIVYCPPSSYKDEKGNIFNYKFIMMPDGNEINPMSAELISELRTIFISNIVKPKIINDAIKKEKISVVKLRNLPKKLSNDKMSELLDNLHQNRADDQILWIMTGLALKHDGYEFALWDKFSKRSNKYQQGEPYYIWYNYLFPSKITTGTLIYWLQEDNKEEYIKLSKELKYKDYDGTIDMVYELEFNVKKMYNLLIDDVLKLGEEIYIEYVGTTKSFKYFNNFHLHYLSIGITFKIIMDGNRKRIVPIYDLNDMYSHFKVGKKGFIQIWKSSIDRQMYDLIDFCPMMECPLNTFNTFTGFTYETENKQYDITKINPLLEHLKYICNSVVCFEYLIKWISHIRQYPMKKTGVAIILYSDTQGTGKNTAVDIICELFRGYTVDINEEDINNRFNKKMESKLLVTGDEISGNNKHDADRLKNLITKSKINIEQKGKESYEMNDFCNFIFTTNHSIAFKIDIMDRRMFMIHCNENKRDAEYYSNIYKLIKDKDAMIEFDKYISKFKLEDFNVRDVPITNYKKENILYNLPAYIQMVRDKPDEFSGKYFSAKELYNLSRDYARNNKLSYSYTEQKASKDLHKFLGKFFEKQSIGNRYVFPENLPDIIDAEIKKKI